jgi:hypothetical protein
MMGQRESKSNGENEMIPIKAKGKREKEKGREAIAPVLSKIDRLNKWRIGAVKGFGAGQDRFFGLSDVRKTKIPSTKHQIPNKFQVPNPNDPNQDARKICCPDREFGRSFPERVRLLFVWVIWTLVLQSYQLLKAIFCRSAIPPSGSKERAGVVASSWSRKQ